MLSIDVIRHPSGIGYRLHLHGRDYSLTDHEARLLARQLSQALEGDDHYQEYLERRRAEAADQMYEGA